MHKEDLKVKGHTAEGVAEPVTVADTLSNQASCVPCRTAERSCKKIPWREAVFILLIS